VSGLTVTGLVAGYGPEPVLRGLDLVVPDGGLAAVLGPSGCGKTTLLRVIAGLHPAQEGRIELAGRTLTGGGVRVPPERRGIGIVPQEGALFPHLSVAGNVGFGLPRGRRSTRVDEMLELVGLGGYGTRMPAELSGGQQQRVALARALAPGPALVLLDEPFSALDTGLRAALREDVRVALRVTGATAVLVTHDQQEALSMADVVAVLQGGAIAQAGSPADLYRAPRDLDVATFVGEAVVLDAEVRGGRAHCVLGTLDLDRPADDGPARVLLRPEQLRMAAGVPGAVPARVRGVDFYGHDSRVWLDLAGGLTVSARLEGVDVPATGDEVSVAVAGTALPFPAGAATTSLPVA
jgi:iron(III) transport system ATP-binding protein